MENSIEYVNHVNIVKDLHLYSKTRDNQKPYAAKFEEIYAKAKEENVKLDTAKEFLHSLTKDELRTLKGFEGLAEAVNIDALSDEGAYNLLVHKYEEYDFNNDGKVEVGEAKIRSHIPKDMDDDAKRAWVKTLNTMYENDDMLAVAIASARLNHETLIRDLAQHFNQMSDAQLDKMQEQATFDIRAFINETLSKPYNPETITMLSMLEIMDDIINPTNGAYSSPELIESAKRLKEIFTAAYDEVKKEKLTTQKGLEIKKAAEEKLNEEKEEPLVKAIESVRETGSVAELKERSYSTEAGKEWYDWRNQDGDFNEKFKIDFQAQYDRTTYAKEIFEKYGDKIFD